MARKPRAADASVGGRPSADIDVKAVERAAAIGCTVDEISAVVGVSRSTFYDHMKVSPELQEAVSRGRETGRATLRRLQWQRANGGSDTMLIWLGKQMLEQKDRTSSELSGPNGGPIQTQQVEDTRVPLEQFLAEFGASNVSRETKH